MSKKEHGVVSDERKPSRRLLKGALLVLSAGAIIQPTGAVMGVMLQGPPKTETTPQKATAGSKAQKATVPKSIKSTVVKKQPCHKSTKNGCH